MNFDSVDPGIRDALQQITKNYGGRNFLAQVAEVERLQRRFRHTIRVVDVVQDARPGPGQFTCFMHALELSSPPLLVTRIMERFDLIYPGAEFIDLLISNGRLHETSEPEDGDVALYFDDERPKHGGKIRGEVIVSKWGLGHVWQHAPFEVPSSYGSVIRTFKRVEADASADWFIAYAAGMAGPDIIAALEGSDAAEAAR
jgi:hypothetical protein